MKLIVVESPTKARTISKFLSREYSVQSSFGHVRDLPKTDLGVDVENDFQPKYVIPAKARKTIAALKKLLPKSNKVIMATDQDREGEAISWHLLKALGLEKGKKPVERIIFHEITKRAIDEALKNPRDIDMNLVDAQQARRILDRLVGYKLSPFLWRKVARGLSAGRVQSVAVRLIVEREKEIENFKPEEYWTIEAELETGDKRQEISKFTAFLSKINGEAILKPGIKTRAETDKILKDLEDAEFIVFKVERKETKRIPPPPFVTSTLQQEAFKKLRFSSKQTMMLAQQLYETGLITYMRTDSTNLSDQALWQAKDAVINLFSEKYWAGFTRRYKTKSRLAQEAHEAVRPTEPARTPESIKEDLTPQQFKLYDLIWRRFMATQMKEALFATISAEIVAKNPKSKIQMTNYVFSANGQTLKFDGFLKIYPMKFEEVDLPELTEKEKLELLELKPEQHWTRPPPRYNEASLVKTLEKYGIGRPSTYAPIISTIQDRNYVQKDRARYFHPTEIGRVVNDLLVEHFPDVVDIKFTSNMEEELDEIAEGKEKWVSVLREFYGPFSANLEKKYKEVGGKMAEETDEVCEKCGGKMVIRMGRFGKFLACSNFPRCKNTRNLETKD